jgi:formylglycine-generating enzyme required for sulfatase activity
MNKMVYNLYNMANVSEWTDSSYDPNAYEYVSQSKCTKTLLIINGRGGSWKDVAYFLQVSTRDFEYADSARSFISLEPFRLHGIANNRKRKEN